MASKITTTKHHIIFDIDSTTIGGGLFRFGYDSTGSIIKTTELFSVRKNITNGSEYPFERFFTQTLKTLESVANEVYLQSLIPIDAIYCNVGIPWMSAQKRIVEYKNKKKFTLTTELMDELTEKEINESFKKNVNYTNHDVELIDRRTLSIYGNGYQLRKPLGKEMNDVHIHSLVSVMSQVTKDTFSKIIEKVFHRDVVYLSNTYISYQTLREQSVNTDNAIIIDISAEVTEVIVVQNDSLEKIGSIPVGTHGIIRHLRDNMNIPYEKASRIAQLHHDQKLDVDYSKSINSSLRSAFLVWFKEFYNLCDEYAKSGLLPTSIILRSDKRIASWLEYMILQEESLQEHVHAKGRITFQHMNNIIPDIDNSLDNELGIVASFISQHSLNSNHETATY